MKLVPYEMEKLGPIRRRYSENRRILEEFVESGLNCAEIENFTQKSAQSAQSSLIGSIKRYKITTVQVAVRKNRVFLIRKKP